MYDYPLHVGTLAKQRVARSWVNSCISSYEAHISYVVFLAYNIIYVTSSHLQSNKFISIQKPYIQQVTMLKFTQTSMYNLFVAYTEIVHIKQT